MGPEKQTMSNTLLKNQKDFLTDYLYATYSPW